MMKKVVFSGMLVAALGLGNLGLSSLAANSNSGLSVAQLCNTSIVADLLGAGTNTQGASQGDCEGANSNSGTSVLQGCNTSIVANILGLGQNTQDAEQGSCGGGGGEVSPELIGPSGGANSNTGLSVAQLCNTLAILDIAGAGQNDQAAGQGDCGDGSNTNSGVNVLQSAALDLVANVLGLGQSTQYAAQGATP